MELVPAALETRCLILLPAAPGLAPAVLDYYLRNAAFLAPFEPERPAGFYTAEHHARELAADVQRAAQGTGVRFYLALKDVPGRVIGSVALNNIVRGAFQSCFLGYKLDGALDPLCVRDFCAFCGYTETEFWAIMDKFYNRDLFEKDEYGRWMLKEPIWKEN